MSDNLLKKEDTTEAPADMEKFNGAVTELIEKNKPRLEELKRNFDAFLQDQNGMDDLKKKILESGVLPADLSREQAGKYLASILDNLKKGNDLNGFVEDFKTRLSECKALPDLEKCFEETYNSCAEIEKIVRQSAEGMFSLMLEQYRTASFDKKEREALKAELDKYRKLSEEYLEMSRSLKKDYTRMRERLTKEKDEIAQTANKKLLCDLLEVADNLEEALNQSRKELDCEKSMHFKGVSLVWDRLKKIFSDNQVKEMEVIDKPFDPVFHEALAQDLESGRDEGTITEIFKKGYFYRESVLRSALVRVAAGKPKIEQTQSENH
ncbi:MAG: nucleotide exchange factor GrpE [Candidatus Wallbacteria bacterium]|nr:nucleotide exchange factor GrpE [Candidatus Wallbacteria bacterium]